MFSSDKSKKGAETESFMNVDVVVVVALVVSVVGVERIALSSFTTFSFTNEANPAAKIVLLS